MSRPVPPVPGSTITLLTDFGLTDPFVGVMKGVLAALAPASRTIDLTHDLPPQDVAAGAFWLGHSAPYFPNETVHLAVVDPGVGTRRRALAARAQGQFFVAPDNGLLDPFLASLEAIHVLDADALGEVLRRALPGARPRSATFHGRDVFAPAAALLARGEALSTLGPELQGAAPLGLGPLPARVEVVDRFGNLITNVAWPADGLAPDEPPALVRVRGRSFRWVETYGQAHPGECVALLGSVGTVEIAVRDGSAARELGVGPREPVEVVTRAGVMATPTPRRAQTSSEPT